MGAPVLIKTEQMTDPLLIAEEEFRQDRIPITVKRAQSL
jgi:DNA-directed RNA polymerase subunit K/omega